MVITGGKTPKGRNQSLTVVRTHTSKVRGNPQNKTDNPRTKRRSERISWTLAATLAMPASDEPWSRDPFAE